MQSLLTNWKTTLLGVGAVLTAAGTIATHLAAGDTSVLASAVPGLLAGIGLLFGKDATAK